MKIVIRRVHSAFKGPFLLPSPMWYLKLPIMQLARFFFLVSHTRTNVLKLRVLAKSGSVWRAQSFVHSF